MTETLSGVLLVVLVSVVFYRPDGEEGLRGVITRMKRRALAGQGGKSPD